MTPTRWFDDALRCLPEPDPAAATAMRARADDILRPSGALARLDDVAVQMAGWQRTSTPSIRRPAGLIFVADHGVATSGEVSAYPTAVTAAMLAAFNQGRGDDQRTGAVSGRNGERRRRRGGYPDR